MSESQQQPKTLPVLPKHVVQNSKSQLQWVSSVIVDTESNALYCAVWGRSTIGKFALHDTTNNNKFSVIAGSYQGYLDGAGTKALFRKPYGISFDNNHDMVIADYGNNAIRLLNIRSKPLYEVTTIISSKHLMSCSDVKVDNDNNLYVALEGENKVVKVSFTKSTKSATISLICTISLPFAVNYDKLNKHLFVSSSGNCGIYILKRNEDDTCNNDSLYDSVGGNCLYNDDKNIDYKDDTANWNAYLQQFHVYDPVTMISTATKYYVCDKRKNSIKIFDKKDIKLQLSTVYEQENVAPTSIITGCKEPFSCSMDIISGMLYIADTFNHRILKMQCEDSIAWNIDIHHSLSTEIKHTIYNLLLIRYRGTVNTNDNSQYFNRIPIEILFIIFRSVTHCNYYCQKK